jgi:hypothetical protein
MCHIPTESGEIRKGTERQGNSPVPIDEQGAQAPDGYGTCLSLNRKTTKKPQKWFSLSSYVQPFEALSQAKSSAYKCSRQLPGQFMRRSCQRREGCPNVTGTPERCLNSRLPIVGLARSGSRYVAKPFSIYVTKAPASYHLS